LSRLSTAQTLSLVTAGIVLVVLVTALVVVRHALTQAALDSAQDRLDRSVRQLANVTATNVRTSRARYAAVARDPAIIASLRDDDGTRSTASAEAALKRLSAPTDSGLPIELWSANGRRVAFVGDDVKQTVQLQMPSESPTSRAMRPGLDSLHPGDSLQVGLLSRREDNRTGLWLAMPVMVGSNVLGFILQARRIARNPQTEQTIRELSGNSAAGFYHNVDGSNWTTFGGEPAQPPANEAAGEARSRPNIGPVLYAEERVQGTPLVLAMEVPRAIIVARAQRVVGQLALYGIALTILGALVALLIGRHVMRPLNELTSAAKGLAGGDYSRRVADAGTIARRGVQFHGGASRGRAPCARSARSRAANARQHDSADRVDGERRWARAMVQRSLVRVHGCRSDRATVARDVAVPRPRRSGQRHANVARGRRRRPSLRDGDAFPIGERRAALVSHTCDPAARSQRRRESVVRHEHGHPNAQRGA
jgi:hypothetical protein